MLWLRLVRFVLAILVVFCCYRLIVDASAYGLSRLFTAVAIYQPRLEPADRAVRLAPNDPEAHYTRGLRLVNMQRLDEAVAELRQAVRLRPNHYYEWLDLGVTLDRLGDQKGAMDALRESVRLAPTFAQPRWQLGNLLFRQERYPEAFAELRLGAQSNPSLLDGMLELAWAASGGDVKTTEALVQPQNPRSHLQLARFLAKQGKGAESAQHVQQAGQPTTDEERGLLRQTVSELLAAREFSAAFQAWKMDHAVPQNGAAEVGILNGNFLDSISRDDPGFAWQLSPLRNVSAAIDPSGPDAGSRSLLVEFSGESPVDGQLVQQLVLLEPATRYAVSFMARTEELVSGGPPMLVVLDAGSNPMKRLGESKPLSAGTNGWTAYRSEFVTEAAPAAIIFNLQRQQCTQSPCPIFGKIWLSKFSVSKL